MATPNCPDCQTEMEMGFIPDFTYAAIPQMVWHPGDPVTTKFLGFDTQSVDVDRNVWIKTISYRCPDCGLLRLYAPERAK